MAMFGLKKYQLLSSNNFNFLAWSKYSLYQNDLFLKSNGIKLTIIF